MHKWNLPIAGVLFFLTIALHSAYAAETQNPGAPNYARPFEPPTRPAFLTLPPGAIEPAGWLRDWCLAAKDGYTGHMDEVHAEFQRAWAADHKMTGKRLNWPNGAWPYEGGGYWFDGLARLAYALHDDALIQQAKKRLDVVADHTNPNGILFLWWLDKNKPDDRKALSATGDWSLWACGLLGRAMTGYYAGSRDPKALKSLETAYSSDPNCLPSIPGNLSNLWPAFDTYTWTGNKDIAKTLDAMFDRGHPTLKPNLDRYRTAPSLKPGSAVENQHVVEFLESTTPWALGYLWTGDIGYLKAALGWHDLLAAVAMQPNGVPVADEWYLPTGSFRGTETCDVAGYVWSQAALLATSGEGRLADRLERAFFNAGPATVTRDFKNHVYFQSPNRFANGSPDFPHGPMASGGSYKLWHMPLCCTAALNRVVPYYVTNMWMATYDNGLAATCYGPCKVTALVANRVPVEIACKTDYPFNETIEMSVNPAKEATFPLLLHIPGWCKNPELSVNGAAIAAEQDAKGFARIVRTWKPGDSLRLRLPMQVVVTPGRDDSVRGPFTGQHKPTIVRIPEKTTTQGLPYASVSYGPLLFALPIADTKDTNTPNPSAKWNYALDMPGKQPGADIRVEHSAMPAKWDWPLTAPLKLVANAATCQWTPTEKSPLPAAPVDNPQASEKITLIPYGCTKLRVSMFPVTQRLAHAAEIASDTALTPIELDRVKLEGEIGRRIDNTIQNNLLALDVEKDFFAAFRARNKPDGYIGLGKLIDASVRFAAYSKDPKVLKFKDRLIAEAVKTQEPDGYIGILIPQNRLWGVYDIHEMSHIVLGLANDYKFFGNKASLAAARKLADFVIGRWSAEPNRIPGPTGKRGNMYGVTTGLDAALLTLYEQSHDRKYLDFVTQFKQYKLPEWKSTIKMDEPGKPDHMDDERHCYIFMALCVAQLQLNRIEPDPRLLDQAMQAMRFLTENDGLLVSGSCSLGEAWHDNQCGAGRVSESCATAYLVRLLDRLLRITSQSQYGNMMERAVYNALFAAESPDGRKIRYFTALEGPRVYFDRDTFCCPNNFRRIMAELPGMVCYRSGDGLAVNLFTQSTATIPLEGGRSVAVRQQTDYPTSGQVKIVLTPSEPMEFPLRLRIPGWCPKAKLSINGESPIEVSPGKEFYEIRRTWKPNDTITIDMPMPWRLVRGRKMQQGKVALMRGPVVYCIGTAQNAELLKKYKEPGNLIVDPASLGNPVADASVGPDGLKVAAKAWPPGDKRDGPATLDIILTEFPDPSGVTTYFRVPDSAKITEDELLGKN
jgi:uncharacterized protein